MMTNTQHRIWNQLKHQTMTTSEIAHSLSEKRSTVSRRIREMKADGYVEHIDYRGREKIWMAIDKQFSRPQLFTFSSLPSISSPPIGTTLEAMARVVVNMFVDSHRSFSAYDVTKEMREITKKENILFVDLDKPLFYDCDSSGIVPNVPHDKVKDVVRKMFDKGDLYYYSRTLEPAGYWLYFFYL